MTQPDLHNVSVYATFRDACLSLEKRMQLVCDEALKQSAKLRLAVFPVIVNRDEVVIFGIDLSSSSDEDWTFT